MTKKIKMTKAETKAKDAGEKNSIKYEELKEYMEMYPTFEVLIKANTKRKVEFRGLDYKYMTRYIKMHDDENGSKIDFMNRTIVMTCQFAKECANPKSKE